MTIKDWIELIAVGTGPLGLILLMAQRLLTKKSIGARTVQFATVVLLFPIILVLGMEKVLDSATIGTMLGGVAGFVLSRVGEYQPTGSRSGDE
jgi:hypothetical protein